MWCTDLSSQNAVVEIEMARAMNDTVRNDIPVRNLILSEVPRSPAGGEETIVDGTNDYLEIIEYAPTRPPQRSWEIPRQNVTIEKHIGKGAFGQVVQGKVSSLPDAVGATTVAIKMLKGNVITKED